MLSKVLLNIAFKVLLTAAKGAVDSDDDDELLPSPDPVSYTHLDVYKRQGLVIMSDMIMTGEIQEQRHRFLT